MSEAAAVPDPAPADDATIARLVDAWRDLNRQNVIASFTSADVDFSAERAAMLELIVAADSRRV